MADSKYLQSFEEYAEKHEDMISPAWKDQFKTIKEDQEMGVYTFIMQYIFM
ncbi:MAG: hypothetical protein FWF33_05085 [Clostridiales bacterium]|nr:hypothetical protein [Clostridiales bacterium]